MFSSRPELGWQEASLTVKKKNETGGIGTEGAPKETLGARLRRLAKTQGLNQTTLAKKVGLDRTELNRLVNDKRQPKPEELAWLAEALKTTVEDLLQDVELPDNLRRTMGQLEEAARRTLAAESSRDEAVARQASVEEEHRRAQERWAAERAELLGVVATTRESARIRCNDLEQQLGIAEAARREDHARWEDERAAFVLNMQQLVTADRALRVQVDQLQRALTAERSAKAATGILAGLAGLLGGAALSSRSDDD